MSLVTEVVLTVYPTTPTDVQKIVGHPFVSERPSQSGRAPQFLSRLDSNRAGGTKYASWDVFQAAFNYVDTPQIVKWFETEPCLQQLCCILMITDDSHDEGGTVRTRNLEYVP